MTAVADSSGFKPTDHQALLQRMSPFAKNLIVWQKQQGRHDLPWQGGRDAYRVWLSEIMLQQTQVTTVIPYYRRFLESFPEVTALAQAPLNTVLEHWAGLGYYARARNLHRCAQLVSDEYGGQFPQTPEALAGLPGIGRSTAAAIAVFAFGARAAILDGNVKRVLARCFGIEGFPGAAPVERSLWALAETLLPEQEIEAYTQGLMDLGASLCARNKPQCAVCPQQALCVACREGRQGELPLRRPTKVLPERRVSGKTTAERYLGRPAEPAGMRLGAGGKFRDKAGLPATGTAGFAAKAAYFHPFPADNACFARPCGAAGVAGVRAGP